MLNVSPAYLFVKIKSIKPTPEEAMVAPEPAAACPAVDDVPTVPIA